MKKIVVFSILSCAINVYASKIVSNDRTLIDKFFISKNIENKINGRYDFNKDIAVISDIKNSKNESLDDALKGLENEIYSYTYKKLKNNLQKTNLIGPGFNDIKMKELAKEIASRCIEIHKYKLEGIWMTNDNQYYTLLKIDKETLDNYVSDIFKIRLEKVIQTLIELKEGI